MVIWDAHDDTYKCTCKIFEFVGILCRHIIRVCQQNNVAQINPIYFIPRWRKDLSECDLCFRYIAESLQFPSSEQEPQLPDSANEHIESQPTAMYHDLNQYCREICRKAANVEQFQSTKAALAALLESLYTDTQSLDQKTSPTVQSGADRILNPPLSNPKGRKKETRKKSFAETASKREGDADYVMQRATILEIVQTRRIMKSKTRFQKKPKTWFQSYQIEVGFCLADLSTILTRHIHQHHAKL